jgi:hypothetical protein
METKDIKELMLLESVIFTDKQAELISENKKGNLLHVISEPLDSKWYIGLYSKSHFPLSLTDEQYNMICKHVENEYYEYHSNNTAFTDDDIEHFNSLIN